MRFRFRTPKYSFRVLPEKRLFSLKLLPNRCAPVARSPVDNLAQSVDGGHSRKRLHPRLPTAWAGLPTAAPITGARPPNPLPCHGTAHALNFSRSPKTARG